MICVNGMEVALCVYLTRNLHTNIRFTSLIGYVKIMITHIHQFNPRGGSLGHGSQNMPRLVLHPSHGSTGGGPALRAHRRIAIANLQAATQDPREGPLSPELLE